MAVIGAAGFGFDRYLKTYVKNKAEITTPSSGEKKDSSQASTNYQRFLNDKIKIQMLPFEIGTFIIEKIVFNEDIKAIAPDNYLRGEAADVVKMGGNRVYFEISIHNKLMTDIFVSGSYFIIKTTDGEQLNPVGFQKSPSGYISPGLFRKGWIAFNLKRGQVPEVLEYSMEGEPLIRFEHLNRLPVFGGSELNQIFADDFCPPPMVTVLASEQSKKKVVAQCGDYQNAGKFIASGKSLEWNFNNTSK